MRTVDVVVVGAGIVGLAVAREVTRRRPGASVVVLEREDQVAAHQTGHNSGVIHGGIYYQPGSMKARLCVEGARLMYEYCEEHQVPHDRCGKLIVAKHASELGRLDDLEVRAHGNGVPGVRRLTEHEIREVEPGATGVAALHAPNTGIVNYREVSEAIRHELTVAGVTMKFGIDVTAVREGSPSHVHWTGSDRASGVIAARKVIVCAGLWADRLARRSGAGPDPRIVPFRGVYLRLTKTDIPVVRGMIYPVPDPQLPFLGVHLTRQLDGHVLLGPTAMLVPSRDSYRLTTLRARDMWETVSWPGTWKVARRHWRTGVTEVRMAASKRAYVRAAAQYVPALTTSDLDRTFHSGVRAQAVGRDGTLLDDFAFSGSESVTHLRNAPSPAATSAFALAREIVDRAL